MKSLVHVKFKLNGREVEAEVPPNMTLVDMLRLKFGVTSVKKGCGVGECGACTVLLNGKPVNSCLILAPKVNGKEVTTVEGLLEDGKLSPIQEAFIEEMAIQCGYCTPGFILVTKALLDENKNPSIDEIKEALSGNLCRCTGYVHIIRAVRKAAEKISKSSL